MRLLIVEDDPLIARSLEQALGPLGNTVETFSRLSEARAALAHESVAKGVSSIRGFKHMGF